MEKLIMGVMIFGLFATIPAMIFYMIYEDKKDELEYAQHKRKKKKKKH